jgi:hypothetical protein
MVDGCLWRTGRAHRVVGVPRSGRGKGMGARVCESGLAAGAVVRSESHRVFVFVTPETRIKEVQMGIIEMRRRTSAGQAPVVSSLGIYMRNVYIYHIHLPY